MKQIPYIFLLSVLVASCSNLTSPKATVTPQVTLTFTPTFTPTITLTPTETPDPNKPSDATGKDPLTGEYTKTAEENGNSVIYIWKPIQFGNDAESGTTGHWFKSWMAKGAIDLTGYGENLYADLYGINMSTPLNVYAIPEMHDLTKLGYIYHPDGPSDFDKNDFKWLTLASRIADDLFLNYYSLLPNPPSTYFFVKNKKFQEKYNFIPGKGYADDGYARFESDWRAFGRALKNNATIHVGDDVWQPSNGYDVYWIDTGAAKSDPSMHLANDLYWKVMVKDEKLIAILACAPGLVPKLESPKPQTRERTFRAVVLFPLAAILNGQDPSENTSWLPYQEYGGAAGPDTTVGGKPITTSFIAFVPTP